MKSLVIGNTSQLSYFFPNDYVKVSSRDLDYDFICSENWEKVFIYPPMLNGTMLVGIAMQIGQQNI